MTRDEIKNLIKEKQYFLLSEEGEDAGVEGAGTSSFGAASGGAGASTGSSSTSSTNSFSSSSTDSSFGSSTSSNEYNNDDVLFGDGSSDSLGSDSSFGAVSSGSGEIAPQDNPFQDKAANRPLPDEEPVRYKVTKILEKDPDYPEEETYLQLKDIKTNEVKIVPLSQIDLA